jgi:hypothetical protein
VTDPESLTVKLKKSVSVLLSILTKSTSLADTAKFLASLPMEIAPPEAITPNDVALETMSLPGYRFAMLGFIAGADTGDSPAA